MLAGYFLKMKIVLIGICGEHYLAQTHLIFFFLATFFVASSVNWYSNHIPYDLRLI
jgi:hypothetical protein